MSEQAAASANDWGELEAACDDAISALTHLQAFFAHKRMHEATSVVLEPAPAPEEKPEMAETWLTPQEVADRLRIKESTVRRWLRVGELEGINIGFMWRISSTALAMHNNRRKGEGEA